MINNKLKNCCHDCVHCEIVTETSMTEYTMHIYAPATNIEAGIQVQKNIRDNNRSLEVVNFVATTHPKG